MDATAERLPASASGHLRGVISVMKEQHKLLRLLEMEHATMAVRHPVHAKVVQLNARVQLNAKIVKYNARVQRNVQVQPHEYKTILLPQFVEFECRNASGGSRSYPSSGTMSSGGTQLRWFFKQRNSESGGGGGTRR